MATLFAGTSGFAYPSWKPDFYPPKCPAKDFLKHYATRLNAVEINYTFRQLPKATTLENWIAATPEGFTFVCKAHQRITHILRLRESEFTEVFFKAIDPLRATRRLGPVLFQLAPNLKADLPTLTASSRSCRKISAAPSSSATSPGWWTMFTGCSKTRDRAVSGRVRQVRGSRGDHGRVRLCAAAERGLLTGGTAEIADRVRRMLADGRDVYVFFKHEDTPAGAVYAEELLKAAN